MPGPKKIAVLLHEKDRYPKTDGHFIWELCRLWRAWGIEVEVLKGVGRRSNADLLIPHVDATVVPDAYVEFLAQHPRVMNRGARDISKRAVSRNLLTRNDRYDGPVIVKTDRNCGGVTDLAFYGRKVAFPGQTFGRKRSGLRGALSNLFRNIKTSPDWRRINCIGTNDYPVFASLEEVPEAVFENPALVVERLLPEYEEGFYHIRYYLFFGDRDYCWRLRSPNPVVKRADMIRYEQVETPEELRRMRREFDLDYGKLDFVLRDGQPVLLDVNRTPGILGSAPDRDNYAQRLAPGIHTWL